MILALEYPEPVCPFKDPPPETIDPLEHGVIETSRRFRNREGTATCTPIDTRISNPTITTSVTHNNCRFASSQIIPNVGVQVYYAYSDEPLYKWYIPPQITVPKKGPHAGPLEWERAIAGIMPKWNKLKVENPILLNTQINMDEKKEELASVNGSKISEAKSDRARANEKPDICNVMNIEQQNRNVTENFGWNDASILTGEKIIGAEMCSDYKMDGQVKSQIELDEEAASAFDKLYPGDFRIHVDYSVVDVLVPMNKMISMEAGDKSN
uniref:Uncharacterized protein n=2 Tax=Sipha flava TaxID=143950 RepID=A0A2S2QM69_9HEMI